MITMGYTTTREQTLDRLDYITHRKEYVNNNLWKTFLLIRIREKIEAGKIFLLLSK